MARQQFFHAWMDFKTKKQISFRPSTLRDKYGISYRVCFLKQRG